MKFNINLKHKTTIITLLIYQKIFSSYSKQICGASKLRECLNFNDDIKMLWMDLYKNFPFCLYKQTYIHILRNIHLILFLKLISLVEKERHLGLTKAIHYIARFLIVLHMFWATYHICIYKFLFLLWKWFTILFVKFIQTWNYTAGSFWSYFRKSITV